MNIIFRFKKIIIATATFAMVVVVFLVHALAGLDAHPVVFADPPVFVEQYAAQFERSDPSYPSMVPETDDGQANESEPANLTTDFSNEEALMHKVFFDGESPDLILRLFTHPEKAQRVKMALAFATVNTEFSHNEESGFPEKREQFWQDADVDKHVSDIQNALFEALIISAKEGITTRIPQAIPYTLAWWMPVQYDEKAEMLTWAAKHHPDPWVRWFSVFYVIEHGGNEELAVHLLQDRRHDPDYRVRKQVLSQRLRRLIEGTDIE